MKKGILVIITLMIVVLSIFVSIRIKSNVNRSNVYLQNSMYNFLQRKNNRISVYNKAAHLHGGRTANTCVYFVAEVLRKNKFKIPNNIGNTAQLIPYLKSQGWKTSKDYKQLIKGDICFTTGENLDKDSTPTHTYIFMRWVQKGKYDYAYICDNQAKDYKYKIYHIRNINIQKNINGKLKDPFNFFMYK